MNPWEIWLWPWIAASALTRRALETGHGSMEANGGDAALRRVSEPEWASSNHVTIELDAMRVRDFSVAGGKQRSTLVVAPFALHDARIADLSSGHSLIETLRANGCSRLFLVEWKSATAKTKLHTIDSHLCDLNVAVDDIGPPVDWDMGERPSRRCFLLQSWAASGWCITSSCAMTSATFGSPLTARAIASLVAS